MREERHSESSSGVLKCNDGTEYQNEVESLHPSEDFVDRQELLRIQGAQVRAAPECVIDV